MVKLMGHIAMGLLWALPVWFVWDGRVALAFVGFVLATVMLPDVDLVLRHMIPGVEHHGVTHTVLFVTVVAVVAGLVAAPVVKPMLQRWWVESEGEIVSKGAIHLFVVGGLLLGGLSHLFTDMLSAPDIAQPVEPFWPFFDKPVSFDLIYYSSAWWNLGLLIVAAAIHFGLMYLNQFPFENRYRIQKT
ncbi:metal-dependent hydrolase [Haladaptatus halobius]|uniref:metal-dependent hydrolase n=1 Tax=Haladaptatus halobius TaxID=2884875 RepID=UPI001D0AFD84|nr:metal-dependent hydrolase [Haladaptatus halobius]